MTDLLWSADDIAAATGARMTGRWGAGGVSIDSRSIAAGEMFVALVGENNDAHRFVRDVLAGGAAGALVSRVPDGLPADAPLALVPDTMAALEALGQFARNRCVGRFVAVTGSVGKTSTKDALTHLLGRQAATYGNKGNLNNNFGVPLSLARLPADVRFGVFELGMNHPGEIAPLARQVRPEVVIVTAIAPAHVAYFVDGEAGIAVEKASIAAGLVPGGTAILCRDTMYYPVLKAAAEAAGAAQIVSFGASAGADLRLISYEAMADGGRIEADLAGQRRSYRIGALGLHQAMNSLAVLGALAVLGGDIGQATADYAAIGASPGRGQRHVLPWNGGSVTLFDESYNASPVAVRAALGVLAGQAGRRIAVLGDMLELGDEAPALHQSLVEAINSAGLSQLFACGPLMKPVYDAASPAIRAGWAATSEELTALLLASVQAGDVVTIKGSLGMRMGPLVSALRAAASRQGSAA